PFLIHQRLVRRGFRRDEHLQRGDGLPAHTVERRFLPALPAPQLVVTKVQGNPPEPGRKLPAWLVIFPFGEHASEGFLRQILGAMDVAGHPRPEPLNRAFPAANQLGERAFVILRLDAPHRLLIRDGKERAKRRKGSGPHTTYYPSPGPSGRRLTAYPI